jgi:hypothetical protein
MCGFGMEYEAHKRTAVVVIFTGMARTRKNYQVLGVLSSFFIFCKSPAG